MEEKNDYIQLPPMKKDTSADVGSIGKYNHYMSCSKGRRDYLKKDGKR